MTRNYCYYFIQAVVRHFGATYAYGPRFAPDSPRLRAEDFGFIVPATQAEYDRWLQLTETMRTDRADQGLMPAPLRQRRSRAAQQVLPRESFRYSLDSLRQMRLDNTDYGLDFSEILLIPEDHRADPGWLAGPDGLPNCPPLEHLVQIAPDGSYGRLEVPA